MLLVIVAKAYPGLEEPHLAFFPICLKTYTTGHPPQLCLNMTMAHFHQELLKIKFLTVRPKPPHSKPTERLIVLQKFPHLLESSNAGAFLRDRSESQQVSME